LTNHIVGRVAASAIASASWMSFFCALAIDRRRHLGLDDLGQGLPGQADDTTCPNPAHQPAWPSPPRAKWSEKRFLRRVDWRSIPTHLPDEGPGPIRRSRCYFQLAARVAALAARPRPAAPLKLFFFGTVVEADSSTLSLRTRTGMWRRRRRHRGKNPF
jgi:hypothetical protein